MKEYVGEFECGVLATAKNRVPDQHKAKVSGQLELRRRCNHAPAFSAEIYKLGITGKCKKLGSRCSETSKKSTKWGALLDRSPARLGSKREKTYYILVWL